MIRKYVFLGLLLALVGCSVFHSSDPSGVYYLKGGNTRLHLMENNRFEITFIMGIVTEAKGNYIYKNDTVILISDFQDAINELNIHELYIDTLEKKNIIKLNYESLNNSEYYPAFLIVNDTTYQISDYAPKQIVVYEDIDSIKLKRLCIATGNCDSLWMYYNEPYAKAEVVEFETYYIKCKKCNVFEIDLSGVAYGYSYLFLDRDYYKVKNNKLIYKNEYGTFIFKKR